MDRETRFRDFWRKEKGGAPQALEVLAVDPRPPRPAWAVRYRDIDGTVCVYVLKGMGAGRAYTDARNLNVPREWRQG